MRNVTSFLTTLPCDHSNRFTVIIHEHSYSQIKTPPRHQPAPRIIRPAADAADWPEFQSGVPGRDEGALPSPARSRTPRMQPMEMAKRGGYRSCSARLIRCTHLRKQQRGTEKRERGFREGGKREREEKEVDKKARREREENGGIPKRRASEGELRKSGTRRERERKERKREGQGWTGGREELRERGRGRKGDSWESPGRARGVDGGENAQESARRWRERKWQGESRG